MNRGVTVRKLSELGIAVVGGLLIVNALTYITLPIQVMLAQFSLLQTVTIGILSLAPCIALAGAGAYFLRRRAVLAQRWFPDTDVPAIPLESMVRGGLLLLGVYLMVQAIPALVTQAGGAIMSIYQNNQALGGGVALQPSDVRSMVLRYVPGMLAALISFAIGWLLVARSQGLTSRLLAQAISGGTPPSRPLRACLTCGAVYDPTDYEGSLAEPKCSECGQPLKGAHA